MINKELRKLGRRDLVDIIYQMKQNEQQMQEEIAALKEELEDKRIRLFKAGSIADAAADITKLFTAVQGTADLYLNEIACMKEDAAKECEKIIEEAEQKAAKILADAEKQSTSFKKLE